MNENENVLKSSRGTRVRAFFSRNKALLLLLLGYAIVAYAFEFVGFVIVSELICNVLGIVSMIMAIKHMKSVEGGSKVIDIICICFGNPLTQVVFFVILDTVALVSVLQALGQIG